MQGLGRGGAMARQVFQSSHASLGDSVAINPRSPSLKGFRDV